MSKAIDRDPSPPPYTESAQPSHEHVPPYEAPSYGETADGSKNIQSATNFPPVLNGYFQWKITRTFHLGPSAEEKFICVRVDKWGRTRPATITLPARPGSPHVGPIEEQLMPSSKGSFSASSTWAFEVGATGKESTRGRFEWRSSHGKEIKDLATGLSHGWKLVWVSGPGASAGGSRKDRVAGLTSDGLEVVAIIAHNASFSMTKGFRFAFMGAGLTGILGKAWEIATLSSALMLWYSDVQKTAAASAVAASA
ncbi:uncharacterized protein N7484_001048 [Penicillium longicatenatum]|uniref:uncharacterized protein n=1 Tax=Penicillium longicatenatum TaxID=1561947 RepID=UPI002548931C|nr:uncharacterized protein N7484_001048 [Penicillium longicatenatum]KAJ5657399.1 hypothetical protein N7484_001048 [Penicillium longicatenatum]